VFGDHGRAEEGLRGRGRGGMMKGRVLRGRVGGIVWEYLMGKGGWDERRKMWGWKCGEEWKVGRGGVR